MFFRAIQQPLLLICHGTVCIHFARPPEPSFVGQLLVGLAVSRNCQALPGVIRRSNWS